MRRRQTSDQFELKLRAINDRLRGFGVPFALTRLGNYRQGEWQIDEVTDVFAPRDFVIAVCFNLLAPWSGEPTRYWCKFNATYSSEALAGQILVPTVRHGGNKYFLMNRAYGAFIGVAPLVFPRGFIPRVEGDLSAQAVAQNLIERKLQACLTACGASVKGPVQLLETTKGALRLAEDQGTSGNWLTVTTVEIELDPARFEKLPREFRNFKLVPVDDFLRLVQSGDIVDLHTLSAYVAYVAVNKG